MGLFRSRNGVLVTEVGNRDSKMKAKLLDAELRCVKGELGFYVNG